MKTRNNPIFVLLSGISLCVLLSGCMTTPNTGDVLANKTQAVHFDGWTLHPNEKVDIYAMDFTTGKFKQIASTTSSSSSVAAFGTQFSYWSKSVSVPPECWSSPGFFKSSARLKARSAGSDMICWEDGFLDYVTEYDDLGTLYDERSAGTEVWIAADN